MSKKSKTVKELTPLVTVDDVSTKTTVGGVELPYDIVHEIEEKRREGLALPEGMKEQFIESNLKKLPLIEKEAYQAALATLSNSPSVEVLESIERDYNTKRSLISKTLKEIWNTLLSCKVDPNAGLRMTLTRVTIKSTLVKREKYESYYLDVKDVAKLNTLLTVLINSGLDNNVFSIDFVKAMECAVEVRKQIESFNVNTPINVTDLYKLMSLKSFNETFDGKGKGSLTIYGIWESAAIDSSSGTVKTACYVGPENLYTVGSFDWTTNKKGHWVGIMVYSTKSFNIDLS